MNYVVERCLLAGFVVGWYLMVRGALYRNAFDERDEGGFWSFRAWWSSVFAITLTVASLVIFGFALCAGCWIAIGEFRPPAFVQSPYVERGTCAEAAKSDEAKP